MALAPLHYRPLLHRPHRLHEHLAQVLFLNRGTLDQRKSPDLRLHLLALGCGHEFGRVRDTEICFGSCNDKSSLVGVAIL